MAHVVEKPAHCS